MYGNDGHSLLHCILELWKMGTSKLSPRIDQQTALQPKHNIFLLWRSIQRRVFITIESQATSLGSTTRLSQPSWIEVLTKQHWMALAAGSESGWSEDASSGRLMSHGYVLWYFLLFGRNCFCVMDPDLYELWEFGTSNWWGTGVKYRSLLNQALEDSLERLKIIRNTIFLFSCLFICLFLPLFLSLITFVLTFVLTWAGHSVSHDNVHLLRQKLSCTDSHMAKLSNSLYQLGHMLLPLPSILESTHDWRFCSAIDSAWEFPSKVGIWAPPGLTAFT